MQSELFATEQESTLGDDLSKELNAYFTPVWAAEMLWDHFMEPRSPSLVCEPSCGAGNMLGVIPATTHAYGIEIHEDLAAIARRNTGRDVRVGSFTEVAIDPDTDTFFGNPPFNLDLIESFLGRVAGLCRKGTHMGLVLPAFAFQTASRVVRINEKWTLEQTALPRNFFPGIREPLLFGQFTLEDKPRLVNFFLYHETDRIKKLPKWLQERLVGAHNAALERKGGWKMAVEAAVEYLGKSFQLADLYSFFGDAALRPSNVNANWRAKIRQTVQRLGYQSLGEGRYAA